MAKLYAIVRRKRKPGSKVKVAFCSYSGELTSSSDKAEVQHNLDLLISIYGDTQEYVMVEFEGDAA